MRKWMLIPLLLLTVLSCLKETGVEPVNDSGFPEGQPVKISFSVLGSELSTKALGESGDIDSLYVAVFGGSGYLKEYVKATSLGVNGTTTYTDSNNVKHTVPRYTFEATLTLSESRRTVHLLGNGPSSLPFGYETAVLPSLLCQPGGKAYWQMISLPRGIRGVKDAEGKYVPTDSTKLAFSEIPLVRNWAKISLEAEDDSNFTPISMTVVNVPRQGTLVPYSAVTGGFVKEYQGYDFVKLSASGYPGNLPLEKDIIDGTIPDASAFTDVNNLGEGVVKASESLYLYERPAPSGNLAPTYVIVYGTFDENPNDDVPAKNYFYKLDLMETIMELDKDGKETGNYVSAYYPIFRNFRYKIKISKILSPGQDTPQKAAVSAGSADVSADINTQELTDISDGVGRLHVSPWISRVYTTAQDENTLQVYFSTRPDGAPNMGKDSVKVALLSPTDGGNAIISNLKLEDPIDKGDAKGWRPISFHVKEPEAVVRTQTIRVTGYYDISGKKQRLYRDVTITLEPKQKMRLQCENDFLHANKGLEQTLQIFIPDGLVSSMFPLDFTIEPEDMTLTPDVSKTNNNLPVISGASISKDHAGKSVFQFIRTLSWSEYMDLPVTYITDESGTFEKAWRILNCYFKTNCAESATKIWVQNTYFDKNSTQFFNYDNKKFENITFKGSIPMEADATTKVTFKMQDDGDGYFPEVLITALGVRCETGGAISPGPYRGTYLFQPTGENVELTFITETTGGDISLDFQAVGYEDAHLEPFHFNKMATKYSFGLLEGFKSGNNWSNVSYGRVESGLRHTGKRDDRGVVFGFFTDPLDPYTNKKIRITDSNGVYIGDKNDKNGNVSGLYCIDPSTFKNGWEPTHPNNYSGDPYYYEVAFKTNTASKESYEPIVFRLEADGYVTEEFRYERLRKARLHTGDVKTSYIKSWFDSNTKEIYPRANNGDNDDSYYRLKIEKLKDSYPDPVVDNTGLHLGKNQDGSAATGARYKLTFHYGNVEDLPFSKTDIYRPQRFFYCKFTMGSSNLPANVYPDNDAGSYFPYPGSNNGNEFQWIAFNSEDEYPGSYTDHPEEWAINRSAGSKSITFEVGSKPILITGYIYKALSEVP